MVEKKQELEKRRVVVLIEFEEGCDQDQCEFEMTLWRIKNGSIDFDYDMGEIKDLAFEWLDDNKLQEDASTELHLVEQSEFEHGAFSFSKWWEIEHVDIDSFRLHGFDRPRSMQGVSANDNLRHVVIGGSRMEKFILNEIWPEIF